MANNFYIPNRGNINKKVDNCEPCSSNSGCNKLDVFDWLNDIATPESQQFNMFVEIRFKNTHKEICLNTNGFDLKKGDIVKLSETTGYNIGIVSATGILANKIIKKKNIIKENISKKILRLANKNEVLTWLELLKTESQYLKDTRAVLKKHSNLVGVKISDVELQADNKKIIIYFVSEKRIDFRELVQDLSSKFFLRIELKQIGSRQEASMIGGIGECGRELCCSSWLTFYKTVSLNSVKAQRISINSEKITGQCGKLKCCLNYELDAYQSAFKKFPSSKTVIETSSGNAYIKKIDILNEITWVAYKDNPTKLYKINLKKLQVLLNKNKKGEIIKDLDN